MVDAFVIASAGFATDGVANVDVNTGDIDLSAAWLCFSITFGLFLSGNESLFSGWNKNVETSKA